MGYRRAMTPRKSPLVEARAMLEARPDITLLPGTTLQGFQLRRVWAETTKNAHGFNPVTIQQWSYYGQYFRVELREVTRDGRLVAPLAELMTLYGRGGGLMILIEADDPLDPIIERLGKVPDAFADYLARAPK